MNQTRQKGPGGYAPQVRSESDPCNRNVNVLIGVSGVNEEYCWVTQSRPRSWWWVSGGLLSRLPKTTAMDCFHASFCSHSDHLQMSLWVPRPNSPSFGREDVPAGSGLSVWRSKSRCHPTPPNPDSGNPIAPDEKDTCKPGIETLPSSL